MAAYANERPVLLLKKLGGLLLAICGIVLMALAYRDGSAWSAALGILLIAGGVALMAMKIARRNQGGPL